MSAMPHSRPCAPSSVRHDYPPDGGLNCNTTLQAQSMRPYHGATRHPDPSSPQIHDIEPHEAIPDTLPRMSTMNEVCAKLALEPHPEGGFYRETWRSPTNTTNGRALASSILFLLPQGVTSRWHRTDGEEVWIYQAGAPLSLHIVDGVAITTHTLSIEHTPQLVVPANAWQSAQSLGSWTLVCCIVAPAFEFDTFEIAPPDWLPNQDHVSRDM